MPLIRVQTSLATPGKSDIEALLASLSATLAQQIGKPEAYVMTSFQPDMSMTFAGTTEPTCLIEIKSVGTMGGNKTKAMSQTFCQMVEDTLGIPKNRTYIDFADAQGAMWGWNGTTFG